MSKVPSLAIGLLRPLIPCLAIALFVPGCGSGGSSSGGTLRVRWTVPAATGTTPALVQSGHAAVFDPVKDRILITWGQSSGEFIGEAWEVRLLDNDEIAWAKLNPVATKPPPPPRSGHAAAYDDVDQRMILTGGEDEAGPAADDWQVSFSEDKVNGKWGEVLAAGDPPPARIGHTTVFDTANHRIILFGGRTAAGGAFSDAWALGLDPQLGSVWKKVRGGEGPLPRSEHSAVIDPDGERMIVFGGENATGFLNDVWELDWTSGEFAWKELFPNGTPPPARSGHTAVYDPATSRMVVFGGFDGVNALNDVWVLELGNKGKAKWVEGTTGNDSLPEPRDQHIAIRDQNAGEFRMYVYGGNGDSTGDVWELRWTR